MRWILPLLLIMVVLSPLQAEDEPLIPPALNALLPKISAGMTTEEITKRLSRAYPKVEPQMGDWSGDGGYIDFKLDERYRISIAACFDAKRNRVVQDKILIYLYDQAHKHRVEIRRRYWKDSSEPRAPDKPKD
jgi:hypothetical protein